MPNESNLEIIPDDLNIDTTTWKVQSNDILKSNAITNGISKVITNGIKNECNFKPNDLLYIPTNGNKVHSDSSESFCANDPPSSTPISGNLFPGTNDPVSTHSNIANALGIPQPVLSNIRPSLTIPPIPLSFLQAAGIRIPRPTMNLPIPGIPIPRPQLGIFNPTMGIVNPALGIPRSSLSLSQPRLGISQPPFNIQIPAMGISNPSMSITNPALNLFNTSLRMPQIGLNCPRPLLATCPPPFNIPTPTIYGPPHLLMNTRPLSELNGERKLSPNPLNSLPNNNQQCAPIDLCTKTNGKPNVEEYRSSRIRTYPFDEPSDSPYDFSMHSRPVLTVSKSIIQFLTIYIKFIKFSFES